MFDFKREFNKDVKKEKGKVAKGVFSPTFDRVRDNKDSINKKIFSWKKKERAIIIHKKCIICKRPACKKLKACYHAFLKIVLKRGAPLAHT